MTKPEWNVFYFNVNRRQIEPYNVLAYREDDIKKMRKKSNGDRANFDKMLKSEMMYHFWSKCEWETIIMPWVNYDLDLQKKIDVYWQLKLNWDRFSDYCWEWTGGKR